MHKKSIGYIPLGIVFGVLCLLTATALGLFVIHIDDWFYSWNLSLFDVPEATGISREICLENYNAVMAYLSPFSNTDFHLPSLPFSADGAQHFRDCKPLFSGVYLLGAVSMLLILLFLLWYTKRGDRRVFLVSSVTTLAVPVAVVGLMAADFDRAFVLFHEVFFSNDLWLFDYQTDPIIFTLPSEFFMLCAVLIAFVWFLFSLGQLLIYRRLAASAR